MILVVPEGVGGRSKERLAHTGIHCTVYRINWVGVLSLPSDIDSF